MSCINPNTSVFKQALEEAGGNPLLAELLLSTKSTKSLTPYLNNESKNYKLHSTGKELRKTFKTESEFNKKVDEMYDNYVSMMTRKRKGFELSKDKYKMALEKMSVLEKDGVQILGEWDNSNLVFKGRIMGAESTRKLVSAISSIKEEMNFMASVPSDMGSMFERLGYVQIEQGKDFSYQRQNDKGEVTKREDMVKTLWFSNPEVIEHVFNKPSSEVTLSEVKQYDSFEKTSGQILHKMVDEIQKNKPVSDVVEILREAGMHDRNAFKTLRSFNSKGVIDSELNSVISDHMSEFATKVPPSYVTKAEKNLTKDEKRKLFIYDSIKNLRRHVSSAISNKKVEISSYVAPEVYEDLDNDLNKLLVQFLNKLDVKTNLIKDMQTELGIDSLATLDLLNRTLNVSKDNQSELPQEAAYMLSYMLQYNPIVTEIMDSMEQNGQMKADATKDDRLRAFSEILANELHKKTNTKLPKSLVQKLKKLVAEFLKLISSPALSRMNRQVGEIADQIIIQNEALITASIYKPGEFNKPASKVTLQDALDKDIFGADIIYKLSEEGFMLTGSTALAEQGTVFRPKENPLHDIDMVSPYSRKDTISKFKNLYPDAIKVRDIQNDDHICDTFLIAPKSLSITNYKTKESVNDKGEAKIMIESYTVVDKKGKTIGEYANDGKDETVKGVEAKLVDLFSYESYDKNASILAKTKSTKSVRLSHWKDIFEAKMTYGRLKDVWDYNRFVPNNMSNQTDQALAPSSDDINSNLKGYKVKSELNEVGPSSEYYNFKNDENIFHKIDKDNNCKI